MMGLTIYPIIDTRVGGPAALEGRHGELPAEMARTRGNGGTKAEFLVAVPLDVLRT